MLVWSAACGDDDESVTPAISAAPPASSAIELAVGQPISGHLARDETHSYRIAVAAGELIDVRVVQHEADVVVRLFDPADEPLIKVHKLTGTTRPERLLWVADVAGRHRLEISVHQDYAGRYEAILEARRPATAEDRRRVEAEKAFARGSQLAGRGAESRPEAIAAFERALPLWRELGDASRQADTLYRLGRLHYYQRDRQRAVEVFEQTLEILEQAPVPWQQGSVHHWLGHIHYHFDDLERARGHYLQALQLRQQIGFARGEAQTRNNLGAVLRLLGDRQQALEHYEAALPIWRRIADRAGEARTLHNRGKCYLSLGWDAEALDDLEQALEIRQGLGDLRGQATTLNAIAQAHNSRDEPQRAFEAFQRALGLRQESDDARGQAVTLIDLGILHQQLGRPDQAQAVYEQALELSHQLGDRLSEAFALHGLGRVFGTRDRTGTDLEHLSAALDRFEAIGDVSGQVMTLRSMAQAERRNGRQAQALGHLERALAAIEQQRGLLASHTLRYSFFATKQSYYDLYVDLLMAQHRREPAAGHDAAALAASERARARSQLEALLDSGAELRHGVDPQLRRREQDLERQIDAVERQRRWLLEEGREQRLAQLERKLRDLLRQHSRVQGQIRLTSPRYAALTQPRILSAADIQRRVVDRETLLLELDLGPRRSFLWVVSTDAIHSFELPSEAEIEKVARRAYRLLRSSHQTAAVVQTELTLGRLSDMLLGQAVGLLTEKRLLIVSEGALQYIPFSVLPVPAADRARGSEPLGARHEIINIPSASMLAALRDQLDGRQPAEKLIAVVADPVFELDDPRVLGLPQSSRASSPSGVRGRPQRPPRRFERLAFSRLEADRILALASPAESYRATDFDADRDAITSGRLSEYRWLHFATHGELDTEYPQLSRLVLSRVDAAGMRRQDDSLYAHEIYDLELTADLVVLSACETALGAEIRGEGLLGLTQGFFYAGAARVLVSLWKVDDEATAELMARFYQNLMTRGQQPAAALRDAQASIRSEKRWQAPYYWAGFMLLGKWRQGV